MAKCTRCSGDGNVYVDNDGTEGGRFERVDCPVCGGGGEVPDEE